MIKVIKDSDGYILNRIKLSDDYSLSTFDGKTLYNEEVVDQRSVDMGQKVVTVNNYLTITNKAGDTIYTQQPPQE